MAATVRPDSVILPWRYPPAVWRPVSYADEADTLGAVRGWLPHVVVGDDSPHPWFEQLTGKKRAFSHLWVSKDGDIEQYQRLDRESWAQRNGNDAWHAFECAGFPGEPMTDAQLAVLAAWHVWSGARDEIADSPSGRGIGTHSMGGRAWGGHDCPGEIRAAQRGEIIRRARVLRGQEEEDDVNLKDRVDRPEDGGQTTVEQSLRGGYRNATANRNILLRLEPEVKTLRRDVTNLTAAVARLEKLLTQQAARGT